MVKKTTSFRFEVDFIDLLNAWAFVTKKDKTQLLEEAFQDYMENNPKTKQKVETILDSMKE